MLVLQRNDRGADAYESQCKQQQQHSHERKKQVQQERYEKNHTNVEL